MIETFSALGDWLLRVGRSRFVADRVAEFQQGGTYFLLLIAGGLFSLLAVTIMLALLDAIRQQPRLIGITCLMLISVWLLGAIGLWIKRRGARDG